MQFISIFTQWFKWISIYTFDQWGILKIYPGTEALHYLLTDQGSNVDGELVTEVCNKVGIELEIQIKT